MSKRLVRGVLCLVVVAAFLPFLGCDGDDGEASVYDDWQYIDITYGDDPAVLDDGDERQLFTIEESPATWQTMMYERTGGAWVPYLGFRGTYTATADTWAVTLTGISIPSEYPGIWFGSTEWQDYANYPYAYIAYEYYWEYQTGGGASMDVGYELSVDGNTLYMDVGAIIPFTRM